MRKNLFFALTVLLLATEASSQVIVNEGDSNNYTIESYAFEESIKSAVECVRSWIKLKSLDPLAIRIPIPLWFDNKYLRGRMLLRRFRLEGLSGFELQKGTVSPILARADLALNFGQIKFTAKYSAKLKLFGFMGIYGKGEVGFRFNNFNIDARVKVLPIPLKIREVKIKTILPSTEPNITGLLNDDYMSGLISRQLSEVLAKLTEEQQENVNKILNSFGKKMVDDIINPFIRNLTLGEIFEMIEGFGGTCDAFLEDTFQKVFRSAMDFLGLQPVMDQDEKSESYKELKIIKCI